MTDADHQRSADGPRFGPNQMTVAQVAQTAYDWGRADYGDISAGRAIHFRGRGYTIGTVLLDDIRDGVYHDKRAPFEGTEFSHACPDGSTGTAHPSDQWLKFDLPAGMTYEPVYVCDICGWSGRNPSFQATAASAGDG